MSDPGTIQRTYSRSLLQSFNGSTASAGERVIAIPLSNDGPFTLQVNNLADKGSASSGHMMRFKQLSVDAEYTLQTIGYTYDAASRVLDVDTYPGENTASTPLQTFAAGIRAAEGEGSWRTP
ncbi:MAG: hypothetical protein IPK52_13790 [Chloroflexi bacterium]|nr:hypothetical protein [Chloroflexota bacterium]